MHQLHPVQERKYFGRPEIRRTIESKHFLAYDRILFALRRTEQGYQSQYDFRILRFAEFVAEDVSSRRINPE
jgi:hypothetical protein